MEKHHLHLHITNKLKRVLVYTFITSVLLVSLLGVTVASISFKLDYDLQASQEAAIVRFNKILDDQNDFSLPKGSSHAPYKLDPATLINVIARNQPAVVKIFAVSCADIKLSHNSVSITITDACSGRTGSGSLISSDGYIATSGHIVTISPKDLVLGALDSKKNQEVYLAFLSQSGLINRTEASLLGSKIDSQSDDLVDWLNSTKQFLTNSIITLTDHNEQYAVQLGKDPAEIYYSLNRLSIGMRDGVVVAELINQDFDPESANLGLATGLFTSSDVAILKVPGPQPYVEIGSLDNIKIGDQLTSIGYPGLLDSTATGVAEDVVPSVTQGNVLNILLDAPVNGRKIVATSIPISQGSSGGPAFDNSGQQVGISTYAILDCEKNQECFGDGQLRDVADLKVLLLKDNIKLSKSDTNQKWYQALDEYQKGDYIKTVDILDRLTDEYPQNYLAASLQQVANSQIGEGTDNTSIIRSQNVILNLVLIVTSGAAFSMAVTSYFILHFNLLHSRALLAHHKANK